MKQITCVFLSHAGCTKWCRYTEEEKKKEYPKPESLLSWQNCKCLEHQCSYDAVQAI